MIRQLQHVGRMALIVAAVGLLSGAAAMAVDHSIRPYPNYDRPGPCIPNVSGFGYYRTTWRQWPGEQRPEQTFPQAIGVEPVPTPAPQRPDEAPPEPSQPEQFPEQLPPSNENLSDGLSSEPPAGKILAPEEPLPATPSPETPTPAESLPQEPAVADSLFPGLEVPAEPEPLPSTPNNPSPEQAETPFGGDFPLPEPEALDPETAETSRPGPLDSMVPPATDGAVEPEPQSSDSPTPAEPVPLDPAAEDPLPGLRSLTPEAPNTLDDSSEAAPMPRRMLSAPELVPADSAAPTPDAESVVRDVQNEPGPSTGVAEPENTPSGQSSAQPTGFREIDPIAPSSETPQPQADWVSARNPGFQGNLSAPANDRTWTAPDAPLPDGDAGDVDDVDSADEPTELDDVDADVPADPGDLPVEETPVVAPPSSELQGPELSRPPADQVQSISGEPPDEPSAVERSAFETPEAPAANNQPPVALDGFCLYELSQHERWVHGDPKWSAVHHGRTYLFSREDYRRRFLADPDRYAPAYAGYDPVLVVEGNRFLPGKTDFCVHYDGRLYTFSSAVTLARFQRDTSRYATER